MKLEFDYDEHEQLGDSSYIIHGSGKLSQVNPTLSLHEFVQGKEVIVDCDGNRYSACVERMGELSMGVLIVALRIRSNSFTPVGMMGKRFLLEVATRNE